MVKISACVIVKDEEKNLPQWLACVRALASELVVVDTGSTDRTAEMAKAAGASVYSFAWRNDFSAAKNFALQKAKGNWIVFLDADEYFSEEDIPKVRAYIQKFDKERKVAGFFCPLVNIDVDRAGALSDGGFQIRVFRRHPDLKYHGHVHEMLQARGSGWKMVEVRDVRVWHTGYSSSLMRAKAERNLSILLSERERRGESPSDAFYLADCCFGLGRYEEAEEWARKAIASGFTLGGREKRPYNVLLNSMLALKRPFAEVREAVRDALRKFPDTADYKAIEGVSAWQAEEYAEAEIALRDALSMTEPGAGHIRAVIFGHLADIAHRQGQDAQALDDATEALREERFYEPALSLLGGILRALPAADAIQFLNTIYDPAADAEFLIRILAKSGLYEVCLYYDKKAGGRILAEGERLLFAKAYPSAARELARAMTRGYAMEAFAAKQTGTEADLPEALRGAESELAREMQGYISKLEQVFPWETGKGRNER